MRGTIILILGIVVSSVLLVLVAGLVITPKDNYTPSLVSRSAEGERIIVGSISFDFPRGFAVASRSNQLPVAKDIPVCDLGFDYCFYDTSNGTSTTPNEKLGLRINIKMPQSEDSCIGIVSMKNQDLRPEVIRRNGYSASFLGPIEFVSGDDRAYGYIYRIYEGGRCYEVETRLVWSSNGGEIAKSVLSRLNPVIDSIFLVSSGEKVFVSR